MEVFHSFLWLNPVRSKLGSKSGSGYLCSLDSIFRVPKVSPLHLLGYPTACLSFQFQVNYLRSLFHLRTSSRFGSITHLSGGCGYDRPGITTCSDRCSSLSNRELLLLVTAPCVSSPSQNFPASTVRNLQLGVFHSNVVQNPRGLLCITPAIALTGVHVHQTVMQRTYRLFVCSMYT